LLLDAVPACLLNVSGCCCSSIVSVSAFSCLLTGMQGDTGTGKTEILQMLSLLLNSDTQLVPDHLRVLKDLATKLCSKPVAEPAPPEPAAAAVGDAPALLLDDADRDQIKSLMSVEAACGFLLGRFRRLENDAEEAYRWSTICCKDVKQLFEDYPLLVKPAEVKAVLDPFEERGDRLAEGERFQLGTEESV
jgi:energy-coupling factor transporter ATP-binding protein EcfA2